MLVSYYHGGGVISKALDIYNNQPIYPLSRPRATLNGNETQICVWLL